MRLHFISMVTRTQRRQRALYWPFKQLIPWPRVPVRERVPKAHGLATGFDLQHALRSAMQDSLLFTPELTPQVNKSFFHTQTHLTPISPTQSQGTVEPNV